MGRWVGSSRDLGGHRMLKEWVKRGNRVSEKTNGLYLTEAATTDHCDMKQGEYAGCKV